MKIFNHTVWLLPVLLMFCCTCSNDSDEKYNDFGSNKPAAKEGYIVGGIKKGRDLVQTADDVVWGNSGVNPYILLIAANPDEDDLSKCFAADLSTSNPGIYKALNLSDNPVNLQRKVWIYGLLSTNVYGMNGVMNISQASLDNKEIELLDEVNPFGLVIDTQPKEELFCDFEETTTIQQLSGWTSKTFVGTSQWEIQTGNNSVVTITFEAGQQGENTIDSWLITPLLNINNNSKLYFDCRTEEYSSTALLSIVFLEVTSRETLCTEIPVTALPASSHELSENIQIDLSQFANKTGFVGFQASGSSGKGKSVYKLDNIRFTNKREILFYESFGNTPVANPISVNNYAAYDNKNVFRSVNNYADIRFVNDGDYWNSNSLYCVLGWQGNPFSDEIIMNVSHILPQDEYENLELSFDAGTGYDFYGTPLNKITIKCNGEKLEVNPTLTLASIIFKNFSFRLPTNAVKEISFSYTENKNINIAIDNIMITGEKRNQK